jgi:excisionase family DNA binding protein
MSTLADHTLSAQVALTLAPAFIEAVAARAAELLAAQVGQSPEPWIGVDEAALHLCCPRSRIYRLVSRSRDSRRSNPLPFEKDGSRLLFRRSDLDAWVARGGADY